MFPPVDERLHGNTGRDSKVPLPTVTEPVVTEPGGYATGLTGNGIDPDADGYAVITPWYLVQFSLNRWEALSE
jgi:hypothetical protein